jgi:hypothetical protein
MGLTSLQIENILEKFLKIFAYLLYIQKYWSTIVIAGARNRGGNLRRK